MYKLHPSNTHGHLGKGPSSWELKQLGATVDERLHKVATDSISYRERAGVVKNVKSQTTHDRYIHKTGMEMLELLPGETKEEAEAKGARARKNARIGKVLKRRVRVTEMKDGGMSIAIDLEWDTTTWSTEEIQTGCDALVLSFEQHPSMDRKRQAIRMLLKLLERHNSAVEHLKKDIESIMNKCINRRLIHGKSAGALDLLHVLECCANRYHTEYCLFNYTGRFCDLILLESKLAAVIIQTFFRAQFELRQKRAAKNTLVGVLAQGFGDSAEVYRQRVKTINSRRQTLRGFWRIMHEDVTPEQKRVLFGVKGPVHIKDEYVTCGLKTILFLVSSRTRKHAPDNREGIFKTGGMICLSSFLAATSGPYAVITCRILNEVAKSPECLAKFFHSGCTRSLLRYIRYCRANETFPSGEVCSEELRVALSCLTRVAVHAAGLFRARGLYDYKVPEKKDVRPINYRGVAAGFGKSLAETDVLLFLGSTDIVCEVIDIVNTCNDVPILRKALQLLFALSCSECAEIVLEECIAFGGRCLQRLTGLLDEEQGEDTPSSDEDILAAASEDLGGEGCAPYCNSVATLSMSVLLQLCTLRHGRQGLIITRVVRMLEPFVTSSELHINSSYHRAVFLLSSLCRRGGGFDGGQGLEDWRAYDPEVTEAKFHPIHSVDRYAYIDILRCLRNAHPGLGAEESSLDKVIGMLVLCNTDHEAALEFSKLSLQVGPKVLADFVVRPYNRNYFNTLSWELAAGGAVILDALTEDHEAAAVILCPETIHYLGLCLRVCYDELHCAHPKTSYLTSILLNAVAAATEAASRLCHVCRGDVSLATVIVSGMKHANAIIASRYFITFLSELHLYLSRYLFDLQDRAAFASILFMDELSALLGLGAGKSGKDSDIEAELIDLAMTLGDSLCRVVGNLRKAFGESSVRTAQVLDVLCKLMTKLCTTVVIVDESIRNWKIFPSLLVHFPSALDGVNEFGTGSYEFRSGLGMIPPSYYDLLTRLCAIESGRNAVLLDGFLRRALDTIRVVFPSLESEKEHEEVAYKRKCGAKLPPISDECYLFASCLRLCSVMTNFNHPTAGSANELMLQSGFDLVPILSKVLESKACDRKHIVFEGALELTSKLAVDAVRTNLLFKINNITSRIENELQRSSEHSLEGARSCVSYMLNVALGVRRADMRMNEILPRVREGLVKTARYHPALSQLVADALYASTKYSGIAAKDVDGLMENLSSRILDDDLSSNDGLPGKRMNPHELSDEDKELCAMLPSEDILNELVFLSAQQDRKKQLSRQMEKWLGDTNGSAGEYTDRHEYIATPGSYDVCGVSSCGSLHNKDTPFYHGVDSRLPYSLLDLHGKASHQQGKSKSLTNLNIEKAKITVNPDKLEVSNLSAREKELKDMVLQRKQHYGFAHHSGDTGELPVLTIKPSRAEDFGLAARPENRYIFNKATDPHSRRERGIARASVKDLHNQSLPNPQATSFLSPVKALKPEIKMSPHNPGNSTGYSPISKNKDGIGKPGRKSGMSNSAAIEVIVVEDLPELLLTRPPPPGDRRGGR